ncbi:transposase [Thioalkalivibrio sp. HL-Eb18]|uniref:transposase n=1 Tax=Thioalkalivibrio sp. HL-Eb18 TaxID=1266913 RepID=UPI0012DBFBC3|nr:transposase [Thioalkalivibrio sp. HL-Eb18]
MARKRRRFSSEHKERVARMVVDDGLEVSVVCRDQDLGETAVRRWVDQLNVLDLWDLWDTHFPLTCGKPVGRLAQGHPL